MIQGARMLVVTGVAGLLLAGCGDQEIDAGKAEDFVRDTSRAPDLIHEVSCPDDVKVEEGETFECTIKVADGSEEVVTMRQTDDDGHIELAGNRQTKAPTDRDEFLILPENVESLIRGAAPNADELLSVDCPADIQVEKGNDFTCKGRLVDGTVLVFEIQQTDDLGNVKLGEVTER
jgi:hypothetical protein